MVDYSDLYTQGLPYFADDLAKVLHALEHRQCVTLCSAYKMGDRRFVDYLNSILQQSGRHTVHYDADYTFTIEDLSALQSSSINKQKVVLLPWFWRMNKSFLREYTNIMRDKKHAFTSVIVLEPEFLDHPERLFPDTNVPLEVIITRKPLQKIAVEQLLDARSSLANAALSASQREKISKLSGGHIGLVKRLFNLAIQQQLTTPESALQDPAIKTDLLNLEHQYRTLSKETCMAIGLLRKDGSIAIPLLRDFLNSISTDFASTLSPLQQKLLELFESKQGQIVSKKEIHQLMSTEGTYSLWAVYKVVSRFAAAIAHKYRVRNVSGKGYILLEQHP